jgi:hypothetical protein
MVFPSGCQGQKLNRPTFYFMRNASVGGRVDAQRETTSAVAQRECPREDRHGASVEGKSDHTTHISQYRGCGLRCIHGIGDRSTLIRFPAGSVACNVVRIPVFSSSSRIPHCELNFDVLCPPLTISTAFICRGPFSGCCTLSFARGTYGNPEGSEIRPAISSIYASECCVPRVVSLS